MPFVLPFFAIGSLGFAQGGYFPIAWGWGTIGLLVLAAGCLLARSSIVLSGGWRMLVGLGGLLLWTGLSVTWSLNRSQSMLEVQRGLFYVAGCLVLFLLLHPRHVSRCLAGVLAGIVAVCAYALVIHLAARSSSASFRVQGLVGYWNAMGLLAAMGILLALGFGMQAPKALRWAMGSVLVVLVLTLYLTGSRGGWLGLFAGILLFLLMGIPWPPSPCVVKTAGLTALFVVVGVLVVRPGFVPAVLRAFRAPMESGREPQARVWSLSGNGRADLWTAAWSEFLEHPWRGGGAGSFERYWLMHRPSTAKVRDAHSLYLEMLCELGPIGLLLTCGALFMPVAAYRRAREEPWLRAALGAYLAYLVHAAVDWDWEMPVITLTAITCGMAVLIASKEVRHTPLRALVRGLCVGGMLALTILAALALCGNTAVSRSVSRSEAGDWRGAEHAARSATRWMPWSPLPYQLQGEALLRQLRTNEARAAFDTAIARDADDWRSWLDLARVSANWHEPYARAQRLNPLDKSLASFRSSLVRNAIESGMVSTGGALASTAESLRVSFGPSSAPQAPGFRPDHGQPFDPNRGYGWDKEVPTRSRPGAEPAELGGLVFSQEPRTWRADLSNGDYLVRVNVGDAVSPQGPHLVASGGTPIIDRVSTARNQFAVNTVRLQIRTGRLELRIGGTAGLTTLNFVEAARTGPAADFLRSISFLPSGAEPPPGFLADHGEVFRDERGYGWRSPVLTRKRGRPVPRALAAFAFAEAPASWEMALPNGAYDVWYSLGDAEYAQGPHRLVIEGQNVVSHERTAGGSFLEGSASVVVVDGRLTVEIGDGGGITALDYLTIAAASLESVGVRQDRR